MKYWIISAILLFLVSCADVPESVDWGAKYSSHAEMVKNSSSSYGDAAYNFDICKNEGNCGDYTDPRDNQSYQWRKVGNQKWMLKNLNYTSVGANCPQYNTSYCNEGRMYNWNSLMGSISVLDMSKTYQGLCPQDWRLPTQKDWEELFSKVGGAQRASFVLRSKSDLWGTNPGQDSLWLGIEPIGHHNWEPTNNSTTGTDYGNNVWYWTSTDSSALISPKAIAINNFESATILSTNANSELAVRCVFEPAEVFYTEKSSSSSSDIRSSSSSSIANTSFDWSKCPMAGECGTIIQEGSSYNWVKIGTQYWMASNLNRGNFLSIPSDGTNRQFNSPSTDKYCMSDMSTNCSNYGGLYTFTEAFNAISEVTTTLAGGTQAIGLCPDGWSIPLASDFQTLMDFIIVQPQVAGSVNPALSLFAQDAGGTDLFGLGLRNHGYFASQNYSNGFPETEPYFWISDADGMMSAQGIRYSASDQAWKLTSQQKSDGLAIRCMTTAVPGY